MANINLIMEEAYTPNDLKILQEGYDDTGAPKLIFKATLQTAGQKNANGRIYPPEVLQSVVEQLAPKAQNRNLFMELDHPMPETSDPALQKKRASAVLLKNACALITDIQFDGQNVIGTIEVLTTPSGMIVRSLVKDGAKIGFSLRALGSVQPQADGSLVATQLKGITYDVVSIPSDSAAYITQIISESSNIGEVLNELSVLEEFEIKSNDIDQVLTESTTSQEASACANGMCMRGTFDEIADFIIESALAEPKLTKLRLKI